MDQTWHEAEILKRTRQVCQVRLKRAGQVLQKAISKNIQTMELVKTGNLRDSIYLQEMPEESAVRVGTNVPYAAIHEFGGIIKQTITPKQRKFFIAKGIEAQKEQRKKK